jgi:hypothetical protein
MYTKFWKIGATGSYAPESNKAVLFDGNLGVTGITGVSSSVIQQINAIGTASVALQTGVYSVNVYTPSFTSSPISIASAAGTSITFTSNWTGATGSSSFYYFDNSKPAFHRDSGITAIMGIDSTPAAFSFIDANNNTIAIGTGTLKQGEIYEFKINTVTAVTANHVLGMSEY